MKYLTNLLIIASLSLSANLHAEEAVQQEPVEPTQQADSNDDQTRIGFISDDLFLYFHSGPGTQYRILGSMNAGEEVKVLSDVSNEYIQIEDSEGRKGWIDAKYLSDMPGLRVVLAELNEDLANKTVQITDLSNKLDNSQAQVNDLNAQLTSLQTENADLQAKYAAASSELDDKDLNTKITYFKYGAAVLLVGLLFGILLPRLVVSKKRYSSWN